MAHAIEIAVILGAPPHADFQLPALSAASGPPTSASADGHQADRPRRPLRHHARSSRTSRSAISAISPSLPPSSRPTRSPPRAAPDEEEEFEQDPSQSCAICGRWSTSPMPGRPANRRATPISPSSRRSSRPIHLKDRDLSANRTVPLGDGDVPWPAELKRLLGGVDDQGSAGQHRDALPAGRPQCHRALGGRPAPHRRRDRRRGRLTTHVIPSEARTFVSQRPVTTLGMTASSIMRTFSFVTVDVFTDRRFGGNPLAVFPDARGLSDARCRRSPPSSTSARRPSCCRRPNPANTARVRIFNRTAEMPFAGHPNVGTGWVLAQHGPRTGRRAALRGDRGPGRGSVDATAARYRRHHRRAAAAVARPGDAGRAGGRLRRPRAGATSSPRRTGRSAPRSAIPSSIAEVTADALTARDARSRRLPARAGEVFPRSARALPLYLYARGDGRATSARGCSRRCPAPSRIRRRAAPRRRSPPCCCRSATRTEAATTSSQGVEMGRPSLLRCHGPARAPTASAPGSAAAACPC